MLELGYDEIVEKIKQHSGLSTEEISGKINQKLDALQGLISKEGAAHIVANELGLKIFDQPTGKLKINQIRKGMRDLELVAKVVRKFDVREFNTGERSGKVGNLVLGDETGTIRAALWGSAADNVSQLNENDVVKVESAYVRENQGNPEIHLNDKSKIIINPEGESVGEVSTKTASATRKQIVDITEGDKNIEVVATIVQAFDPRFFETCPECNRRARMRGEDNFACEEHGTVKPNYAYLINLVLDDGTSNIRTVFFREQADALTKKSPEEFGALKGNQDAIETLKHDLLGQIVKVIANVKKNDMFDRMELVARQVFVDLNPDDEIAALDKEIEKAKENPPVSAPVEASQEKTEPAVEKAPTIQQLTERKEEQESASTESVNVEEKLNQAAEQPVAEKSPEEMNEEEAINKVLDE